MVQFENALASTLTLRPDLVSGEVRRAEQEIDNAFRSSPLTRTSLTPALWNLLAVADDSAFIPLVRQEHSQHQAQARVDSLINEVRYPIRWLFSACSPGGSLPSRYDKALYSAAYDLLQLAKGYEDMALVLTFASAGALRLEASGNRLLATHVFRKDARYEAYNRLIEPPRAESPVIDSSGLESYLSRRVKISGERFHYYTNRALVENTVRTVAPAVSARFSLPPSWKFSRYSLAEFRRCYTVLFALVFLRFLTRSIAARRGCRGFGVLDAIYVRSTRDLISVLVKYSGLEASIVASVVEDLTYGSRGVTNPDSAIQPLIPLDPNMIAVAPQLFLHLSAERNLAVLLNRIPEERAIYSAVAAEKEAMLREDMRRRLDSTAFRLWSGSLPGRKDLPDIDLAVIDDEHQACLLCELKWFISPADPREVLQKEAELTRGIAQASSLNAALLSTESQFRSTLGLESSYSVDAAVLSATWIGNTAPVRAEVPVIQARHLVEKLRVTKDLRSVVKWLNERRYLPVEGRDYTIFKTCFEVAGWQLEWYGIKPLVTGSFLPL